MTPDPTFTLADALAIQEEHLKQWDLILKPEVAAKLRAIVLATNKGVTNPYVVTRGSDIDHYVHNPVIYLI
jgi:hypothetical protein